MTYGRLAATLVAVTALGACGGSSDDLLSQDTSAVQTPAAADDGGSVGECSLKPDGTCSGEPDRCCAVHGGAVDLEHGCIRSPYAVYSCHTAEVAPYCAVMMAFACYRREGENGMEYVVTTDTWPAEYLGEGFEPCDRYANEIPGDLPACP